jgi:DNA-binding transcriptional MocR family regulator
MLLSKIGMLAPIHLDSTAETPLYRQLYESLKRSIVSGRMAQGERLPANRELAGSLGINRATITAAFELLEAEGLIKCYVGRGTFVEGSPAEIAVEPGISFAASRPAQDQFPLEEFRATCREVIDSSEALNILQLGPAAGYGPLRRWVLNEVRKRGAAGADDDILITSGVQQAFDLIQRVIASRGETVLMEDPVYPGVRNVFQRGGARVMGIPVGADGIEIPALERALEVERARLLVLTPNFQNPTGTTIPEFERGQILEMARRAGVMVIENDLYGALRYTGSDVPSLKQLDRTGEAVLLGGFSKVAFPGLRVGWAIGPRPFIAQLTEAKEVSDLHSDQLSQAVLLRFAESGRLADHHRNAIAAGLDRLKALMDGCAAELPRGSSYTRPAGGMNAWVSLPETLDASELAVKAAAEGVSYLPGRYFAVSRPQPHSLRLSFAGLAPDEIRRGMKILGTVFRSEQERARRGYRSEPSPALV